MATVEERGGIKWWEREQKRVSGIMKFSFINLGTNYTGPLTLQEFIKPYNYGLCTSLCI